MKLKHLLSFFFLLLMVTVSAQFSVNALDFDGANDMVVVNTVPACFNSPATNDFTIEAWVNPRGSLFARILYAQPSTTNFASLGTSTGNVIYFYVVSASTTYSVATSAGIPQNQWTHVAARWTSATNTPQVFFNGVLQTTVAGGSSSTGTSGIVAIGTRPGGGTQYFNGALDEIRVWNEARTQCEIQNNMNNSITGAQTNLVMNYNFNQGVAGGTNTGVTTLPDLSGAAYNGTLTNFGLTAATSNWIASAANVTTSGAPLGGIMMTASANICSGSNYTFPDGSVQTITATTNQVSTLTAFNGCDSIITTTVMVSPTYATSFSVSVCNDGSYTFPDGTTLTNITSATSHVSNLAAMTGCDSVVTTNVSVNPTYNSTASVVICSGTDYTFPDGSTQTAISSTTVQASNLLSFTGCDSVITTTVNVNPTYSTNETMSVCSGGSYTFPDGSSQTNITAQVIYTSNLQTLSGCDSSIVTTVDVNATYALNVADSVCYGSSYTFPDGSTATNITTTQVYSSTLTTMAGCDSIITSTVSIIPVIVSVTQAGDTLTADEAGAVYQWLDCGNGYAMISGETGQSYTPPTGGSYAVSVTVNGCSDTSACYSSSVGIAENFATGIVIYPNPATDELTVSFNTSVSGTVDLVGLSGEVVRKLQFKGSAVKMNLDGIANGYYFMNIRTSEGNVVKQVVKAGN